MEKVIGLPHGAYLQIALKMGVTRQAVSNACRGITNTDLAKAIRKEAVMFGGIRVKPAKRIKYAEVKESGES